LRTDHPLIELRVFSEPSFRVAMIAYVLLVGSQIARLVYVPKQLQELRGFTAMGAGALLIIPAGMSALSTNIGGRLVDRIGPRRPTLMGAGLVVVALLGFSRLTLGTPTALIIVLLSVQSFGFGLTSAPTLVVGLSDLPPRLVAQASAVRSLMGQVAGALAVAGVGAVVAVSMGDDHSRPHAQHAYNRGFLASTAGALLALALAMRLPRHTGHTAQPIDAAALAES
jgi:predicted MFS family arabinose efflux permease